MLKSLDPLASETKLFLAFFSSKLREKRKQKAFASLLEVPYDCSSKL